MDNKLWDNAIEIRARTQQRLPVLKLGGKAGSGRINISFITEHNLEKKMFVKILLAK